MPKKYKRLRHFFFERRKFEQIQSLKWTQRKKNPKWWKIFSNCFKSNNLFSKNGVKKNNTFCFGQKRFEDLWKMKIYQCLMLQLGSFHTRSKTKILKTKNAISILTNCTAKRCRSYYFCNFVWLTSYKICW